MTDSLDVPVLLLGRRGVVLGRNALLTTVLVRRWSRGFPSCAGFPRPDRPRTKPHDPGQRLIVDTVEPDSPTARNLPPLAAWETVS